MSNPSTYNINVDIRKKMTSIVPNFRQGDTGQLIFKVFDNGRNVDLAEYTRGEVYHTLPSGETVVGECILDDLTATYNYTGVEMSEVGFVETMLVLYSANNTVSVQPFRVFIYDNMKQENLSYVGILQELITEVQSQGLGVENFKSASEYNSTTQYRKNNIVLYNGSSYLALQDTKGNTPPTLPSISNTYWQLAAQRGEKGDRGDKGDPGSAVASKSIVRDNLSDEVSIGVAETFNSDSTQNYSYAVTDTDGRLSEFVLNLEGKVPTEVIQAWQERMGLDDVLTIESDIPTETAQQWKSNMGILSNESEIDGDINDMLWGIVDPEGRMSELIINRDGQIPDWVLGAWQERMGLTIAGGNSGEIVAWGDSLTAQGGTTTSYIAEVARLSGKVVYNNGVGGESSSTIASRQGGLVMIVNNITIPANSSEKVQIADFNNRLVDNTGKQVTPFRQGSAGINPCYINGIKGTMSVTQTSSTSNDYVLYFQRETSGDSVVINRPTPIITGGSIDRRNDIMVIFIGQNGGYNNDNNELISQIRAMIDFNTATRKDYIVLGLTSGTATSRADLEKAMTLEFGRRYINLRSYLSTYGMSDLNLTPTQEDITYMSNGSVPPSMLTDDVHHTEATRKLIGKLVYNRMIELNIL